MSDSGAAASASSAPASSPSGPAAMAMDEEGGGAQPRDVKVVARILEEMGVREYDPKVVFQLMEFMQTYAVRTLQDAQHLQRHAGRQAVSAEDVQAALALRTENAFAQPPPRELVASLARERNIVPLPVVPDKAAVLLPPEKYCLLADNYQVLPAKGSSSGAENGMMMDES